MQSIGDWVIFRQPRASGGSLAYFATGLVREILEDATMPGHYYAYIENFLPFDVAVPWFANDRYAERTLREMPSRAQVGIYLRGRSVRALGDDDFFAIIEAGFEEAWNEDVLTIDEIASPLLHRSLIDTTIFHRERAILTRLTNRVIRDRSFRRAVCTAYENRCAITGLQIFDRKGGAEVQAAHILPVANDGPDIISNGIALSSTVHWMFDRHLISIGEDHRILVDHEAVPKVIQSYLASLSGMVYLPKYSQYWPSEKFLSIHRRIFFSGNLRDSY
ncbi:hypothetical protein PMI02_04662 [Novosphingobium sp. AP12]|nr:hypothetical protein PMI02_04662 [Novosphingobium sp. AP12]